MKQKINFGTDGIRGNADKHPFINETLTNLGIALAQWSTIKYKKTNPKVLIGNDTRVSCQRIKKALISGLTSLPLNVFDAQVLPTPAVCQLIQKNNLNKKQQNEEFDFGIVISASHNPYYDNGIKLFDAESGKITKEDEVAIVENYENTSNTIKKLKVSDFDYSTTTHKDIPEQTYLEAASKYKKNILTFFKPNFLTGKKVILDCANGATYKIAPDILSNLGAQVITIANQPTGKNINEKCGALHPEELQKKVLENNADVGFAFDGDGDRLITVNKKGQILSGDDILAILSDHPKFKNSKTVVGTIMSNLGLEQYLKNKNKNLIKTSVGDKYIAEKLAEKELLLGGENSGHIIMKDYMNSGDGIFAALRVLETLIATNNLEMKTFKKFPQIFVNVPINQKKDLTLDPYSKIIRKQKDTLKGGRLIVRYSGTENLLRIMVEDKEEKNAINIARSLADQLQKTLTA